MSTTPTINSYTGTNVACSAVLLLLNHYIIDKIDPRVLHNCSHSLCFLSFTSRISGRRDHRLWNSSLCGMFMAWITISHCRYV